MAKAKTKTGAKKPEEQPFRFDEKMEQAVRGQVVDAAAAWAYAQCDSDAIGKKIAKSDLMDAVLLLAGVVDARSKTTGVSPPWVWDIKRVTCFSDAVRIRVDALIRRCAGAK